MRSRVLWLALFALLAGCGRLRFEDLRGLGADDAGHSGKGDAGIDAQGDPADAAVAQADADVMDAPFSDAAALDAEGLDGAGDTDAPDGAIDAEPSDVVVEDAASDAAPDAADAQQDGGQPPRACAPGWTGDACDQCVRYVDLNSSAAAPDGRTWQTAFKTILEGESAAHGLATGGGPASCQVWVREGRYFIYRDHPINGVAVTNVGPLYGGFAGTEVQLSQRNLAAHTTIIDGASADGSQHVLNPVYGSSGGYLDGFTVTGARNTDANQFVNAGGMNIEGGTTVLRNMTFIDNACVGNGAGVYAEATNLTIEDSRFLNNRADGSGGAIALGPNMTGFTLRNVTFISNLAGGNGGAVFVSGAVTVNFANLVAVQNTAGGGGGAFNLSPVQGTLRAISTSANTAGSSASGMVLTCSPSCNVANAIFWDPSGLPELLLSSAATIRQSIVRGGATGANIRSVDPGYVSVSDLHLSAGSPAIDAAEGCAGPERDIEGKFRVDVAGVTNAGIGPVFSDLGAYEYQLNGTPYGTFSQLCP
jgi:predicted outer membrane repeat protein